MKRYVPFAALFAALAMAASTSVSAVAAEPATSSSMAYYIQNASTPEDHEAIAAHFDLEAAQAMAIAEQYKEFNCHHSKATELQRSSTRFAEITAKRHCWKMLRHYLKQGRLKPRACRAPSQYGQLLAYERPVARRFGS